MAELTIISYGGGEVLFKLFTGIKMLFDSGFIKTLSFLIASISAIYVMFNAYFSSNFETVIKGWFVPTIALVILCFSAKTTVYIEDKLPLSQGGINILSCEDASCSVSSNGRASWTVDKVPLFIGLISKAISTIGHKLTEAVELVFHSPDDPKYTKTGMIFGADTALDMREIIISDGDLDLNLRTFCKNCMLYDLALNLYSLKDLKESTNLLEFLKENTARSRFVNYVEQNKGGKQETDLISCKEAISRISEKLDKGGAEVKHQEKKQIFRHLPIAYQVLTKHAGDSSEIIKQMLAMSVISDEISSEAFAKKRAALQQKTTWKTIGGIADGLVITTRCVIEALIYGAILFVVPMMFLPSGFTYFKTWIWLLVWIQLWPPFYAILDYVSLIAVRGQAEGLFDAGSAGTCCLTLYNTVGLSSVYSNISDYAKSMKVLVPFLSYAILQGGVGSFVHMTSSMFGASQNAASMSASDVVSGNYGFSNTSMDNSNIANSTYSQKNLTPFQSSGYIKSENISGLRSYGMNESTYDEKFSRTSNSISMDSAIQSSISKTLTSSETAHESASQNLSESISNAGRSAMDFTSHLAQDSSYSVSDANGESIDISNSASFCINQVETFANTHDISCQEAWEIFGSLSANGWVGSAGMSTRNGITNTNAWNDAVSIADSKDFKESWNTVSNYAKNYSQNNTDGEGSRLASSFSASVDDVKTASENYSSSLDKLNQAQRASSWYENQSISGRKDITQDFMNSMVEDQGFSFNQVADMMHDNSDFIEKSIDSYISSKIPSFQEPENFTSPTESFESQKESFSSQQDSLIEMNQEYVERNIPNDFHGQTKEVVKSKQEYSPEITRESVREVKDEILQKRKDLELGRHPKPGSEISRRDLDLETLWMDSFDDDFAPLPRW